MKKSLKVLLCAIVILSLALPQMMVLAEGELPVLTNSYVMFANAAGAISALTPNETISATTAVQNSGGSTEVMFSLAQYLNGTLIGVDVDSSVIIKGEEKVFTTSVAIGETTAGLVVKAFIWYKGSMEPISPIAVFPSSNSDLKSMLIDGVPLSGFSNNVTEYTYSLSSSTITAPKVAAHAVDNGSKVTITDPVVYPGKTVITVTSSDLTNTKTFNINYTAGSNAVTNLRYLGPTTNGSVTWSDKSVIAQNFKNGDLAYADRTTLTFSDIKSDLQGYTYIRTCLDYNNGSSYPFMVNAWQYGTDTVPTPVTRVNRDWLSFDINHTAEVLVFTESVQPLFASAENGWKKSTDSNGYFKKLNNSSAFTTVTTMCSKEFIVGPGQTQTVTLGNLGAWGYPYTVLIKFKYVSPISNLKYLGPKTDGTGTWTDTSVIAQNLQNGQIMFNDRTVTYFDVNDVMDLKGNYFIKTMNDYNNAGSTLAFVSTEYKTSDVPWLSFDLRQSADVIIVSERIAPTFATVKNGWVPLALPDSGYFLCRSALSNMHTSMVVKEYQVTPGTVQTVTLNSMGNNKNGVAYTVIVRFK